MTAARSSFKDGVIVGRGWTQDGGRPHAEVEALRRAGEAARGATLYVTLEPCCTHGRTPPCTNAIIAAGLREIIIGTTDPNLHHAGRGLGAVQVDIDGDALAERRAPPLAGLDARIGDPGARMHRDGLAGETHLRRLAEDEEVLRRPGFVDHLDRPDRHLSPLPAARPRAETSTSYARNSYFHN